jgi:tetratricopeptide (TPR) repeat protein
MSNIASRAKIPPIDLVILFISRATIKQALRPILKEHGVREVLSVDNPEECLRTMKEKSNAVLILDYEHGEAIVNRILGAAQSTEGASQREIYLMAGESKKEIVIAAAEYNVSRVHIGEITRNTIMADLQFIAAKISIPTKQKQVLTEVAALRKSGDHKSAAAKLRKALSDDPENIRIALELSECAIQVNSWDESARLASAVLSKDPSNLRAMHLLARCNMKEGNTAAAIQLLEQASSFNRLKLDRLLDFGEVLMETGRFQEAKEQFDLASQVDKHNKTALFGQGKCELVAGDINDALELLSDATDGHELAAIFNSSAILTIKHGNFADGIKLYNVALKSVAKMPKIAARLHYNMGLAHYKDNQLAEALKCFVSATVADPNFDSAANNAKIVATVIGDTLPPAVVQTLGSTKPITKPKKSAFQGGITDFIDDFDTDLQEERVPGK